MLPSTSENVREIWDGNRVVRQTGEPKTIELLYDSVDTGQLSSTSSPIEIKCLKPVISLAKALEAHRRAADDDLTRELVYKLVKVPANERHRIFQMKLRRINWKQVLQTRFSP
jgi:hypothetical protein